MLYLSAIVVKARAVHRETNKLPLMSTGFTLEGTKHALHMWMTDNKGAKLTDGICVELANGMVKEVLNVC